MSVDLTFITIVDSEGVGGSSMLEDEEEGVHELKSNNILFDLINYSKSMVNQSREISE